MYIHVTQCISQYTLCIYIVLHLHIHCVASHIRLLRDVGQSEVGLINSTMGSAAGPTVATNQVLAIADTPTPGPPTTTLTAAQKEAAKQAKRTVKMTDL